MKDADYHIERQQRNQHSRYDILQGSRAFCSLNIREHDIHHKQICRCHLWNKRKNIVDKISKPQCKQTARHRISQPESPAADKADNVVSRRLLHIHIAAARLGNNRHQLCKRQAGKNCRDACQKDCKRRAGPRRGITRARQHKNRRSNHRANTNHQRRVHAQSSV